MAEGRLSALPSCPHNCGKPPRFPYVAAVLCDVGAALIEHFAEERAQAVRAIRYGTIGYY